MNPDEQRSSCPGYLDEYGIWNNGFECPSLSGQKRVCCGSDSRRYCCTLENFQTSPLNPSSPIEKSLTLTNQTSFSLAEKLSLTVLTLPILLTCILVIILFLLFSLIILLICYRYQKQHKAEQDEYLSTNRTLFVDHFPFSPPHHQLFFNNANPKTCLLHPKTKDPLTTSLSSSSARIPSETYFNDWKEFFTAKEQPMNMYPTMSCHSNELNNDYSYLHANYLFHGKHQQNGIIV